VPVRHKTNKKACIHALRLAKAKLGESPSRKEYNKLGLSPSSTTIMRQFGGWNAAKEEAGLDTTPAKGGPNIQPPPIDADSEIQRQWEKLSVDQRWYYRNTESSWERKRRRREDHRSWVREQKSKYGCDRCGKDNPEYLDFHHDDPKTKADTVSELVTSGVSLNRIRKEISYCTILCANCHTKEHNEIDHIQNWDEITSGQDATELSVSKGDIRDSDDSSLNREQRLRTWSHAYKKSRGCSRCGEKASICLQFHHTSDEKSMGVGEMINNCMPTSKILSEVEKCTVLCANCHRMAHT
jgi:hypothetical protein